MQDGKLTSTGITMLHTIPQPKLTINFSFQYLHTFGLQNCNLHAILGGIAPKYEGEKLIMQLGLENISCKIWMKNVVMCGKYSLTKFANFLIVVLCVEIVTTFGSKW